MLVMMIIFLFLFMVVITVMIEVSFMVIAMTAEEPVHNEQIA